MNVPLLYLALVAQLTALGSVPAAAPTSKVELVIYSDFQCPFCRLLAAPAHELEARGVDGVDVTVSFKNFPLPSHQHAPLAHQAAMAAKAQGRFWEMHDLIFGDPAHLQRADLLAHAARLGLDLVRFETDMDSDAVKKAIPADIAEGARAGVTATPSYFVNGILHTGARSLPELTALIVSENRRARAVAEVPDSLMANGPAGAPVTIELFADLLSPLTRNAVRAISRVQRQYPSAVRVQFRNMPLSFHPHAMLAHEAAVTAARSGRFWEFIAYVLDRQTPLDQPAAIDAAARVGLNTVDFTDALREHRYLARVEADRQEAARRGLRGSPVIVINSTRIDGVPTNAVLIAGVEAALAGTTPRSTKRP